MKKKGFLKNIQWDKLIKSIKNVIGISIGCFITAVGLNLFLVPNQIAAGGISGLGIILLHLYSIPIGITILVLNIPLFIAGMKNFGVSYGVRSFLGAAFLSVFIEATAWLPNVTEDFLLASVYGGIIVGVGIGIVFRSRGSTGGTAIAAQLLNKFTGVSVGQSVLAADFLIVVLAGYFFNHELALYAIISIAISGKVIDMVQQGFGREKAAIIISEKYEKLSSEILDRVGRGVTIIDGHGGYTGKSKKIVFVVFNMIELTKLKDIVYDIDPNSFLIVTDASEVLGEGFKQIGTNA